jgi:S1-C subfamily serine protease
MNKFEKSPSLFSDYYKKIVRITSHQTSFDWLLPFQKMNTTTSTGSGFFIDDKGHILTCSHCIEDATKVYVEIPSEGHKKYDTVIKGVCPYFDLAIIQILNYKNELYCEMDDGLTNIEPGYEAYALGYPLGQDNMKITKGIISGQQYNFYQTDTAINPGNSGGPLLYNDKVIGINAAGIDSAIADGIGYAVPISRYYLIKTLLHSKKPYLINYPQYFGFEQNHNTSIEFQQFYKNKCKGGGIYIQSIYPKSPASVTKIKKGDILCKINDIQIDYFGGLSKKWMNENMTLQNLLVTIGINKKVKITYWNGKKMKEESFKFRKYEPPIRNFYPIFDYIDYENIGGLIVMNLCINTILLLDHKNIHLDNYLKEQNIMKKHIIVTNILKGCYIERINILKQGDIITKVNDKRVNTVDDFRKYFVKPINNKFIKIETINNKLCILPISKLKSDDRELQKTYLYTRSKLL